MQQARPSDDWSGPDQTAAPPQVEDLAGLDMRRVRARIDAGLLMVFGPDGDPLPPHAFIDAATDQGEVEVPLEGGPFVPVARLVEVLAAQTRGKLVDTDDEAASAWLLAMLGAGQAPDEATAAERAAENAAAGDRDLMLFGQELFITVPSGVAYLLRPHGGEDPAAAVRIVGDDGSPLDHDALIDAMRSEAAGVEDGTVPGAHAEADGTGIRLVTAAGTAFRLLPCGAGETASSLLLAPDGETHPVERLVEAFAPSSGAEAVPPADEGPGIPPVSSAPVPADGGDGRSTTGDGAGASGHAEADGGPAASAGGGHSPEEFPDALSLGDDGMLDLSWLAAAAPRTLDGPVERLTIRGLPKSVRPTVGARGADDAWVVGADELATLTLLATPEGLEAFTLDLTIEGAASSRVVAIPVALGDAADGDGETAGATSAIAIDVVFPPPLSPKNELGYFAVVMVDGVPPDAALTAGVRGPDGRWTLAPEDIRGLRLHLPAGARLPCTLEATGINIENRDGVLATARSRAVVGPGAVEAAGDRKGTAAVGLDFGGLLEAAEGERRRVDAVALSGLPPVAELSRGRLDRVSGCWVLRRDELEDVALTVRDPALERIRIRATAVVGGLDGAAAALSRSMEVALPAGGSEALQRAQRPGFFRSLSERRG